jgi:hypothetical protein
LVHVFDNRLGSFAASIEDDDGVVGRLQSRPELCQILLSLLPFADVLDDVKEMAIFTI